MQKCRRLSTDRGRRSGGPRGRVGKLTLVDCYRLEGDVLDLRGDWLGAQAWYANAVKLGPSIPSGCYSWCVAPPKHGALEGGGSEVQGRESQRTALGRSAQGVGRCAREAGQD